MTVYRSSVVSLMRVSPYVPYFPRRLRAWAGRRGRPDHRGYAPGPPSWIWPMDLDPIADTAERAELRATMRRLVADVAPAPRVAALDAAEEFDDELFVALADV